MFFLLPVQYAAHLFRYLTEWRKNPQWSFTCCLALLLPLSDFQEATGGMVQTNGQTEETDMPSLTTNVKHRRTVDALLEADGKSDNKAVEIQDGNYRHLTHDNTKCHQGTQTEPFMSLTAHVRVDTRF